MTALFGLLPSGAGSDGTDDLAAMERALRVDPRQVGARWIRDGLAVGLLEIPGDTADYAPVASDGDRFHLWFAGEAFDGGGLVEVGSARRSRTVEFRRALLGAILARGLDALAELDGEWQLVLWDARERRLTLANDRFGGLALYWGGAPSGFAFAGGVRGVLAGLPLPRDPDATAIREAVTFGGYRTGDRTNVASVKMMPGGSLLEVRDNSPSLRRYWSWRSIAPVERGTKDLVPEVAGLFRRAMARRLDGSTRPGQTLSGGLDSRAILAAAHERTSRWTAITYGLPGCDDAIYAERACRITGATWIFQPLEREGWLDERDSYIQSTDGLIDLSDLCHLELTALQRDLLDLHLSGYIGDAVVGGTFNLVATAAQLDGALPVYRTPIGLSPAEIDQRLAEMIAALGGAPVRFAAFEHKLPQSTNRWSAAWRPWLRVRKPFTDYALFDFCQGLPVTARLDDGLRQRWVRETWPALFRSIPDQKTGLPVLTPRWRVQVERARRYAWRTVQPSLERAGLPAPRRIRNYRDDDTAFREVRDRIERTLDKRSLCAQIFGADAVAGVVDAFFRHTAPAQVVAALYSFERYHAGLAAHLRSAR